MAKKSQLYWDEAKNKRLMELVRTGVSAARAAAIFKRSIVSVQHQARKLGKPFPPLYATRRALKAKIEAAERS